MGKKQRARELRESGMTYAAVGEALGVCAVTISNWISINPCTRCECDRDTRKGWHSGRCPECSAWNRQSLNEKGCKKCRRDYDSKKGWNNGKCPNCLSSFHQSLNERGCVECGCDYDSRKGWNNRKCPICYTSYRQCLSAGGCSNCGCDYDLTEGWKGDCCPVCLKSRRYGISPDQVRQLPTSCGICGRDQNLCIDHCHSEGHVRGKLCSNCNRGIGFLKDSPELLEKAIEYLEAGPFQFSPHGPQ